MIDRGKREKNEKGEWRNGGCVWQRGNIRGMDRGKLGIVVWMREIERGGGESVEGER